MKQHLIALISITALSYPTSGQCFTGADNLSGPCATPTAANLPAFPAVDIEGAAICWLGCDPELESCVIVSVSPPVQDACGSYTADLNVVDCFGAFPLLSGSLVMDYTRTWGESFTGSPPADYQVYRFVVKIDVSAPVLVPCTSPTCLVSEPTAFYYGYLDYAFDCGSGQAQAALVLFHNCDWFIHHPKSTVPGTFHPDMSFAIVAPSTPANPFVASEAIPPTGPLVAEAVRKVPQTSGGLCTTEDSVSGTLIYGGSACLCPAFSPTPMQLAGRFLLGMGTCTCGGSPVLFQAHNTLPNGLPWIYQMTTSIGSWTTDVGYPGQERVWVDEVAIRYLDSCPDAGYGEIYYGASTAGGYAVDLPLTQSFTDLASNLSFSLPGPVPTTVMGSVLPTRNLIYVNQ